MRSPAAAQVAASAVRVRAQPPLTAAVQEGAPPGARLHGRGRAERSRAQDAVARAEQGRTRDRVEREGASLQGRAATSLAPAAEQQLEAAQRGARAPRRAEAAAGRGRPSATTSRPAIAAWMESM